MSKHESKEKTITMDDFYLDKQDMDQQDIMKEFNKITDAVRNMNNGVTRMDRGQ
jgi:hypothetical protein